MTGGSLSLQQNAVCFGHIASCCCAFLEAEGYFYCLPNNDKMTSMESWLVSLLLVGFLFMIADNLIALA